MDRLLVFPQPFPDEILYSLIVRYHKLVASPSYRLTSQEVFETYSRTCGSILPCCLGALSRRLAEAYSVEELIDSFTLLPLYQPFLSDQTYGKAFDTMAGDSGAGLKMSLGITASRFLKYASFRYCDTCVKEDLQTHGCAYWHRSHLIPGTLVCVHHGTILRAATFPQGIDWRGMFLPNEVSGPSVLGAVDKAVACSVAEMQFWGLYNPDKVKTLIENNILKNKIIELDFIKSGRISEQSLRKFIKTKAFNCPHSLEFQEVCLSHDWVFRILRPRGRVVQPFKFYQLCWLLGLGVVDFKTTSKIAPAIGNEKISCKALKSKAEESLLQKYRLEFSSSSNIRCHDKPGYTWLYRNDRKWLKEYVEAHAFIRHPGERVDWQSRDDSVAEQLLAAYNELIETIHKPIKITKSSLVQLLTFHRDFLRTPAKFPISMALIKALVETEHDYQIRKIKWAVKFYRLSENSAITVVYKCAGIRIPKISKSEVLSML